SFAQAGLLPALQAYYSRRGLRVDWAVFRPSRQPLAALADALTQLGLPAQDALSDPLGELGSAAAFNSFIQEATPPGQISVLVVDQFEELFSQSDPPQRQALFSILDGLLPFEQSRLYVIATMRSDYLPELFQLRDLYSVARQGIDLRAMTAGELKEAIERPLQVAYPAGDKRWEPALIDKLASDASADAAYLPLLQVTLEEIWAGGSLTLSRYGTLTDAIKERAEAVYAYSGPDKQPRTQADQTTIMLIFLDLVDVSLDDEARRDVRRRRMKSELLAGSLERARLVDELAGARLLSISVEAIKEDHAEKNVEMVDIIHETLIRNWDRLQSMVAEKRQALQQRVRFEQAVGEWLTNGKSAEYLLSGVRLAEARALERRQDITLRDPNAHELLARSTAKQEAEQRQALEEQKRRADEAAGRARVLRLLLAFAGVLLLVALSAAAYAFVQQGQAQTEANARATAVVDANNQRNTAQQEAAARATAQAGAERQLTVARAQALAANAQAQAARDPELSLLLAMQSISTTVQLGQPAVSQAVGALHTALGQPQPIQILQSPLEGHTAPVNRASFSPDGRFVLTAGVDGTAKIWESGSGRVARTLASGSGSVAAAVWSPDGKFVATGGAGGAIRIWNASSAQILYTLQTGANSVASLAYSPDGRSIAAGTGSGIAQIWDAGGAGQLRAFKVGIGSLSSVAYSPDGRLIAIADTDGRAGLWDSGTGLQTRALLDDPKVPLNSIAYAADGRFIAIAGFDGKATVIDASTYQQIYRLSINGQVNDIVFSPDGQSIAATGGAGTAIWTAATGQVVRLLNQEYQQSSIAFSPDGRYIVTASNSIDALLGGILGGSTNNTATDVLGRSTRYTAMVWDATGDRELPTLSGHTDAIWTAAYSPNQRYVATASQDGTTRIWDANSGQSLSTLKGHSRGVDSVAWSPDGRTIATASQDGTVKIWDSSNWQELRTLRGHTDIVRSVEYSPDGRTILTASDDATARVWDAATGQEIFKLCCHNTAVFSAAYNPDGSLIATVSLDGWIKIWDAVTGKTLHQFQNTADASSQGSFVRSATWSKDSRYIAIASSTGKVLVWDVNLEKMVLTLQDTMPTESAAFSPDGTYILTASAGGTAKVWDVRSGQLFLTLATQAKNLNYAAWSPDGRFIVAAGDNGVAWQYIFDVPTLMKLAASRTFRSLTPSERAIYMGVPQSEATPASSPGSSSTPTPAPTPVP
nr:PD40 domain-containing protein [Chloroflexota bacterium]